MHFCPTLLAQYNYFEIHLYAVLCMSNAFIFMTEKFAIVWVYHNLFNHSPVDGHMSFFQYLVTIPKVTGNVFVLVLVCTYSLISLVYVAAKWLNHRVGIYSTLKETVKLLFKLVVL